MAMTTQQQRISAWVAVALMVACSFAPAAETTAWGKLKWGMNREQVQEIYPEAKAGKNDALCLGDVSICDFPFTPEVRFEKGTVLEVRLKGAIDALTNDKIAEIVALYSKKYGPPSHEESISEVGRSLTWKGETVISIHYVISVEDLPGMMSIRYENPSSGTFESI